MASKKVAVVGGGLAGMTAAFAADELGATVTLLESQEDLLHLQRGCQLRFIHPNILDWPASNSQDPHTNLPCLNWGAAMAARVCETLLEQWDSAGKRERIDTKFGHEVRGVKMVCEKPVVAAEVRSVAEENSKNHQEPYDFVILAIGFSLESTLPTVPFLSYWENDNFGRAVIRRPIPRYYLVTGCGDGGLIDAIRLSLRTFDHADFVRMLQQHPELETIKRKLLDIDEKVAKAVEQLDVPSTLVERSTGEIGPAAEASLLDQLSRVLAQFPGSLPEEQREQPDIFPTLAKQLGTVLGQDTVDKVMDQIVRILAQGTGNAEEQQAQDRLVAEIQGRLLEEEYEQLDIPPTLRDQFTKDLRRDTVVFLNSPNLSPLSLGASILNRFAVFLLRKFGKLRYRPGKVEVQRGQTGQPYTVLFRHDALPTEELEVHEIVVRQGPISAIDRLFEESISDKTRPQPKNPDDPTREQQYPEDFLINSSSDLARTVCEDPICDRQ